MFIWLLYMYQYCVGAIYDITYRNFRVAVTFIFGPSFFILDYILFRRCCVSAQY